MEIALNLKIAFSSIAPKASCWNWAFPTRCGLRLSYSGDLKTMNNRNSGSLGHHAMVSGWR
jgi:hypothetical protein